MSDFDTAHFLKEMHQKNNTERRVHELEMAEQLYGVIIDTADLDDAGNVLPVPEQSSADVIAAMNLIFMET